MSEPLLTQMLDVLQTIGTFSSAHTAPPSPISNYLSTAAAQAALPASVYAPQSTAYTQLQLYNQLDTLGIVTFLFPYLMFLILEWPDESFACNPFDILHHFNPVLQLNTAKWSTTLPSLHEVDC